MWDSTGKLIYDPKLSKFFKPWWMILKCDDGIIEYYQHWLKREGHEIIVPAWGAHVSVIRGEEPSNKDAWKRYKDADIAFKSDGYLHSNEWYWWIKVESPQLEGIRQELGLQPMPEYDFHITIGKCKDKCIPIEEKIAKGYVNRK